MLRALEETENALVAYREEQERLVKLADQARESAAPPRIARVRYREGAADFLALLDAERTQLQAEDAVAQAESSTSLRSSCLQGLRRDHPVAGWSRSSAGCRRATAPGRMVLRLPSFFTWQRCAEKADQVGTTSQPRLS